MKRLLALTVLILFGFSSASEAAVSRTRYSDRSSSVVAPDRVGRWDIGANAGYALSSDSDDTGYFSGNVAYGVTPWIALGVEAGWLESQVADDADRELGLVPIMVDIIVRIPNAHQTVVPYGVLGLGVIGAYMTDENGVGRSDGDDSSDVAFGWKIGLGVDWFINERWIVNFEWAYFNSDPDLANAQDLDADFWTLGAGLKYVY